MIDVEDMGIDGLGSALDSIRRERAFAEMLTRIKDDKDRSLAVELEVPAMRRLQGQIQLLNELLEILES